MKSLEKDRNRRYETPKQLCEDIGRFLETKPIQARRPSFGYRASKACRRNRTPLIAAASFLFLVGGGIVVGKYAGESTPAVSEANVMQLLASADESFRTGSKADAADVYRDCIPVLTQQLPASASDLEQALGGLLFSQAVEGRFFEAREEVDQIIEGIESQELEDQLAESWDIWLAWSAHFSSLYLAINGRTKDDLDKALLQSQAVRSHYATINSRDDAIYLAEPLALVKSGQPDRALELLKERSFPKSWGLFEMVTSLSFYELEEHEKALAFARLASGQVASSNWMVNAETAWPTYHALLANLEMSVRAKVSKSTSVDAQNMDGLTIEAIVDEFPKYALGHIELGKKFAAQQSVDETVRCYLEADRLSDHSALAPAAWIAWSEGKKDAYVEAKARLLELLNTDLGDKHVLYPQYIIGLLIDSSYHDVSKLEDKFKLAMEGRRFQFWHQHAARAMIEMRKGNYGVANLEIVKAKRYGTAVPLVLDGLAKARQGNTKAARESIEKYYALGEPIIGRKTGYYSLAKIFVREAEEHLAKQLKAVR